MTNDIAPACRHFGVCGGCSFRDKPYGEQLRVKKDKLASLLAEVWQGPLPVFDAPSPDYYRNKMEFSFSHQVSKKPADKSLPLEFEDRFGMKAKGRWDKAFDLAECRISSPETGALLDAVRGWAKGTGLPYYDLRRHSGFFRHLVFREAKNSGQKMVALVTSPGEMDRDGFVRAVHSVFPGATVMRCVNDALSDVAKGRAPEILSGQGYIEEKLFISTGAGSDQELKFRISLYSFFQTNTLATQKLYSYVKSAVAASGPKVLYDFYGGMGSLSFACGGSAEKCVCVESVPEAIEDGKVNAELNGAGNVSFHCAKVEDFIASGVNPEGALYIVDPPRCGMHPAALAALVAAPADTLVYVSCNPAALARDLKGLLQSYKIESVAGFDLFPHTEHVEAVALLRRL